MRISSRWDCPSTAHILILFSADKSGNVKINITNDQSIASNVVVSDDQSGVKDSTSSYPLVTTVNTDLGSEKIQFQPKVSVSRKSKSSLKIFTAS